MVVVRVGLSAFYLAMLAACASAPPPNAQRASDKLALCNGVRVSNAPRTHRNGAIQNYAPTKTVRGVPLMRTPTRACLSSGFGPRRGGAGRMHKGIDLYTRTPAPIYAAGPGKVTEIATRRGFGRTIVISHRNGVATRYAHLSSYAPRLRKGARVATGQVIGQTGRSGNASAVHLHYEILVDGRAINPLK